MSCPKFIVPAAPDFTAEPAPGLGQETYRLQVRLFLSEVRQQALLPTIRSYLRLYTSIPIQKLADFTELNENAFRYVPRMTDVFLSFLSFLFL